MLSKILVGFVGVVLLGIGGFLYWDHQNCPSRQGCSRGNGCPNTIGPCCLDQEGISTSNSTEELSVMPREVSGQ